MRPGQHGYKPSANTSIASPVIYNNLPMIFAGGDPDSWLAEAPLDYGDQRDGQLAVILEQPNQRLVSVGRKRPVLAV